MPKKKTTEQIIERFINIHGDKYNYSLVSYTKCKEKIKIICPEHGLFKQLYRDHLNGSGCPKCSRNYRYTQEEMIEMFINIHDDKYIYNDIKYTNMDNNIEIICPEHGIFHQISRHHLTGSGCPSCVGVKKHTTETFVEKSKLIHGGKYDYSLSKYINNRTKIKIICPVHGIFEQRPKHHLNGVGCKLCNDSKGEKTIINFLQKNNINFSQQKTFKECKNIQVLQFDFYIPNYNICIEYDGIQHFESSEWFGGEKAFTKRKLHDSIKNEYCLNNNIKLIRIRYDEKIEEKLSFLL